MNHLRRLLLQVGELDPRGSLKKSSLKEIIKTKSVDWLSWEDPFIFGKDPYKYKLERENDPAELEKRMGYVLPEIKYLFEEYRKLKSNS